MTLANGTILAVTTTQQDILRMILGKTPDYTAGRVIGTSTLPEDLAKAATPGLQVYVVEPLEPDGSINPDLADTAFEVVTDPAMPVAHEVTMGPMNTAVLLQQVPKSEFLASVEAHVDSVVEQAHSELESELFEFQKALDDSADPEFK